MINNPTNIAFNIIVTHMKIQGFHVVVAICTI